MGGGTTITELLGDSDGCHGLHQRTLSLTRGAVASGTAAGSGEAWYVMDGTAELAPGTMLARDTAVWLPPGTAYRVVAEAPAQILATTIRADPGAAASEASFADPPAVAACRAARPGDTTASTAAGGGPGGLVSTPRKIVSLADCPAEWTGDRKFRVLLSSGLTFTQFVGEIPPGRAPAHHHTYDEVVHVLSGHGVVHRDGTAAPIGPGTSIYLSPYTRHCLENTGTEVLRVLGVFHPAGSPAAKHTG